MEELKDIIDARVHKWFGHRDDGEIEFVKIGDESRSE